DRRCYLANVSTRPEMPVPARPKSFRVNKGESVSDAIAGASCGDIVESQVGVTYTGAISIPAKPCDNQPWITLRTSDWRGLPPEGARVTSLWRRASSAGTARLPMLACRKPHGQGSGGDIIVKARSEKSCQA